MPSAKTLAAPLIALLLAALLGACALGPQRPLYSPVALEDGFGFRSAPSQNAAGALTVTYATPTLSARKFGDTRDAARANARRLAVDLALRRAAELASSQGVERFTLLARDVAVNLTVDRSYGYDGYDPIYGPYRPGYSGYPGYWPGYWPGYRRYPYSLAWVQATARIDVVFGDAGTGTVYDNAEVLRTTYRRYAASGLNVFELPQGR